MNKNLKIQKSGTKILNDKLEVYETFTLSEALVFPTTLYKLTPIKIGESDVESLSSFLSRLAEAHHITLSSILQHYFKPFLETNSSVKTYTSNNHLINGMGELSISAVRLFEELTSCRDLEKLTFIKFKYILDGSKLLKKTKEWCPNCFQEMKNSELPVYEKLIWTIRQYEICAKHNVKLVSQCKCCGSSQQQINLKNRIGFCQKCFSWLGEEYCGDIINGYPVEAHHAIQLNRMISIQEEELSYERLIFSLNKIYESIARGFKKQFSKTYLGIDYSTVKKYLHEVKLPTIKILLNICFHARIDVINLFKDVPLHTDYVVSTIPAQKNYFVVSRDFDRVKEYLEYILSISDKVSIHRICRELGIGSNTLKCYFPELVAKIAGKYENNGCNKNFNQEDSRARENTRKFLEDYINNKDCFFTVKQITEMLNCDILTLRSNFPHLWEEIRKKNLSRQGKTNKRYPSVRIDVETIQIFLERVLEGINNEPVSITEICKELGVTRPTLKIHFNDLLEEIKLRNKEVVSKRSITLKKNREIKLFETIHLLYDNGTYPSMRKVQEALDFNIGFDSDFIDLWRETLKGLNLPLRSN
ncbi:TniQ family protein [Bacillus sp. JJ1127]|uniref:TniQ family protein n=1 Tax=Bacillus sp. JJ1127 TaxID=3122952 RepID=UPI002FFEF914